MNTPFSQRFSMYLMDRVLPRPAPTIFVWGVWNTIPVQRWVWFVANRVSQR